VKNAVLFCACCSLSLLCAPHGAWGHVKWFIDYSSDAPPNPIDEVLSRQFVLLYIVSVFAVYAFFLIDRLVYRRRFLLEPLGSWKISEPHAYLIIRLSITGLFTALFTMAQITGAVYLTPELHTTDHFIPWIQLVIGILAIFHLTAPLAGIGILFLYGVSISNYGFFHLLDYLIFPALAVYMILAFLPGAAWIRARYVVLFASTGLMLGWGAIEKFAYPDRFYTLLTEQPGLALGIPADTYVVLAGFVEFNLAFIMLGSVSVLSRFIAFALNGIFILAINILAGLISSNIWFSWLYCWFSHCEVQLMPEHSLYCRTRACGPKRISCVAFGYCR